MTGARFAWKAALLADTKAATLTGTVSSSVLQVASVAAWNVDEVVHLKRVNGPVANDKMTARVTAIDRGTNRLTVDPAFTASPVSGDVIQVGVQTWLLAGNAVKYRRPVYSSPIGELKDQMDLRSVVILFGALPRVRLFADAHTERWEFRAISKSIEWAEACALRIEARFHAQSGLVAVPGRWMGPMSVLSVDQRTREDELFEYMTVVTYDSAMVRAA